MRVKLNRILIGTLLLPMLLGGLILWSMADRAEHSDRVPTAVVNLDKPVTQEGKQPIYAGRLLAGELTSPRSDSDTSLGWELTDVRDAEEGLANGDYYAVLTIPRDFSETLSGIQGADPETAGITVRSNDSSSALVGQISQQVGDIATNKLGHTITATYLEGVLSQTGVLKKQLGEAADGALKLGDGADQLGAGADRLAGGADQLSSGADRLAGGLGRLSGGADRLADGSDRLAGGAARLEGGIGRLPTVPTGSTRGATRAGRRSRPPARRHRSVRRTGRGRRADRHRRAAPGAAGPALPRPETSSRPATPTPEFRQANAQLCSAADQAVQQAQGQAGVLDQLGQLGGLGRRVTQLARRRERLGRRCPAARERHRAAGQRRPPPRERRRAALERCLTTEHRGRPARPTVPGRPRTGPPSSPTAPTRSPEGPTPWAAAPTSWPRVPTSSAPACRRARTRSRAGGDPEKQAKVISDPVDSASSTLNPALDGETLLTPGMLAFALWLGAFVIYLVREGCPPTGSGPPSRRPASRGPGGGRRSSLGAIQAGLLLLVAVLFGAELASPVGVVALCLLAAAVFTAINQAFTSWFGARRGWIVSIAFAALQVVSLGGLLPDRHGPGLLQALNGFLPIARASDAISHLTLGGQVGTSPPTCWSCWSGAWLPSP